MILNFGIFMQLFFPLSDDERCIEQCSAESFARTFHPHLFESTVVLAPFREPTVRAAIHLVKFHNHPHAVSLLGALLARWLQTLPNEEYLLLPIPLSAKRYRSRGYNQVEVVARIGTKMLPHIRLNTNVLIRNKNTIPQTSLSKKLRESNVTGAFSVVSSNVSVLKDKKIILLDDVATTGATLKEAKKILHAHGAASITTVALAH